MKAQRHTSDYANDAAKFMTNVKPLDHLHLSPNVE